MHVYQVYQVRKSSSKLSLYFCFHNVIEMVYVTNYFDITQKN